MRVRRWFAFLGVAALFWCRFPAFARSAPSLGSAASFAVLAGTSIRNTGATRITGNVGVSPGNQIIGLSKSAVRVGTIVDGATAAEAQRDAANAAANLGMCGVTLGVLADKLAPNVYCFETDDVVLSGTLFLDAHGDRDAVWVFRVRGVLTTAEDAAVRVINGSSAGNVFWDAGEVRIGARTAFEGNILARTHIVFGSGASLSGRAIARTGAVTLDTNEISLCCGLITLAPATLPDGKVGEPYAPQQITASGGFGSYTFAAASLPEGLSLPKDGRLSGVPTVAGTFTFSITATDEQGCTGTAVYTVIVCASDEPLDLVVPKGFACLPYTHKITTGPITTNDPLPPGLSLSSDGVLSGTPVKPDTFTFRFTEGSGPCERTRKVTIKVVCRVIEPRRERLPNARVASDYAETLRRGECPGRHTFVADSLPPGLHIDGDGVLRGKPSSRGTFEFVVTSTAANGCSAIHSYVIDVDVDCAIVITPAALSPAFVGVVYEVTFTASGTIGPYTFSSSPPVPAALTLSATTGKLSGVPAAAGKFPFRVKARDIVSGCEGSTDYVLTVTSCPAFTIEPAVLPSATFGVPYSETFTVVGGMAPYTFEVISGTLPSGLALSTTTGTLSGTPSATGTFAFTLEVTDDVGCSDVLSFCAIDVHDAGCPAGTSITLSPAALPPAAPGVPYGPYAITADGGTAPYTLTVTSDALPPGLTFVGGTISGMPTTPGSYAFTITATDINGCRGSHCYTLDVTTAIPTLSEWAALALSIALAAAALTILGGRHA